MNCNIEYVIGQESHSSNWGKFYVKGLEAYQVKEDFEENTSTNHEQYQGYVCLDVPKGTVFTIFEQSGDKRGTSTFWFTICATDEVVSSDDSQYGSGKCSGNYRIIARGSTITKAPRLMKWWIDSANKSIKFAEHCAAFIDKRGIKDIPKIND